VHPPPRLDAGAEFIVPEDSDLTDVELLEQALEVSGDPDIQDSRRAFHEWRREALERGFTIEEAQAEIRTMMERHRSARRWRNLKTATRIGTVVAAVALGAVAAATVPLVAVAGPLVPAAGEGLT
jgi:hypothetical protein